MWLFTEEDDECIFDLIITLTEGALALFFLREFQAKHTLDLSDFPRLNPDMFEGKRVLIKCGPGTWSMLPFPLSVAAFVELRGLSDSRSKVTVLDLPTFKSSVRITNMVISQEESDSTIQITPPSPPSGSTDCKVICVMENVILLALEGNVGAVFHCHTFLRNVQVQVPFGKATRFASRKRERRSFVGINVTFVNCGTNNNVYLCTNEPYQHCAITVDHLTDVYLENVLVDNSCRNAHFFRRSEAPQWTVEKVCKGAKEWSQMQQVKNFCAKCF